MVIENEIFLKRGKAFAVSTIVDIKNPQVKANVDFFWEKQTYKLKYSLKSGVPLSEPVITITELTLESLPANLDSPEQVVTKATYSVKTSGATWLGTDNPSNADLANPSNWRA